MDKQVVAIAVGAGVGGSQTLLLREFVDPSYGQVIPQIGGFGTISALAGIGLGAVTTVIGAFGSVGKGPLGRNDTACKALIAYGIPTLIGGALSGLYPIPIAARAPMAARATLRPAPVTTVRPTAANSLRTVATTVSSVKA